MKQIRRQAIDVQAAHHVAHVERSGADLHRGSRLMVAAGDGRTIRSAVACPRGSGGLSRVSMTQSVCELQLEATKADGLAGPFDSLS